VRFNRVTEVVPVESAIPRMLFVTLMYRRRPRLAMPQAYSSATPPTIPLGPTRTVELDPCLLHQDVIGQYITIPSLVLRPAPKFTRKRKRLACSWTCYSRTWISARWGSVAAFPASPMLRVRYKWSVIGAGRLKVLIVCMTVRWFSAIESYLLLWLDVRGCVGTAL
jgi:hypothetical protein